jgi:outer membrane protein
VLRVVFGVLVRLFLVSIFAVAGLVPALADFETINRLIVKGDSRAALQLAGRGTEDDRLYAAALLMLSDGFAGQAEAVFKRLLERQPGSLLVRQGLIRAFLAQQKTAEAVRFAQKADFKKLDKTTARDYWALIKATHIVSPKSSKRSGFIVSLNAAPTTNVTGGSTVQTVFVGGIPFTLDADSLQQSGVSVSGSVTAYHTLDITNNLAVRLKGGVSTTVNVEAPNEAEITASLSSDFIWKAAGWSVSLGPVVEHVWREADPQVWRYGAQFSLAKGWKDGSEASLNTRLVMQDYAIANVKDGFVFNASASYGRLLSPVWRIRLQAAFILEQTKLDHLDYVAYSSGFELTRKFDAGGDFFVSAGVDFKQRDYQGKHPLSAGARHDTTTSASVSLAHSRITAFGVTPKLIYEFSVTRSNIDIYATNAQTVRLAINKSF